MNAIGIAYLHGIGAEADTTKALAYLDMAGENGFYLAYHNLGMFHKYASDGKQDFSKAYEAFEKGASKGDHNCQYNKGFMLYKGLGCTQDYVAARDEFMNAANRDHAPSLFMLGLIHRNGYGVEVDTVTANFYLNQAAKFGYADAIEELLKGEPENKFGANLIELSEEMAVPDEMPSIEPYVPNNKNSITGEYHGMLVTYDWSGKYVISEKPLNADFVVRNDSVSGSWVLGNDTVGIKAHLSDDAEMRFENVEFCTYNRYSSTYTSQYRFDTADICCADNLITGSLRLYSLTEQEPERPMYLCIQKDDVAEAQGENGNTRIYAYPNPFVDHFTLNFELDEEVPDTRVCIYTQGGLSRLNYRIGALPAGRHTFNVSAPQLDKGTYVVHVYAGSHDYETLIFKNR